MKIFDSHCHLDDPAFEQDLGAVIERARRSGIAAMMVVGIDEQSSRRAVEIARAHSGIVASVGVHPHDARECRDATLEAIRRLAADSKVRALGEAGLDFNRMHSPRRDQERWFARQLELGAALELPMIFHERDSQGRFLEILKDYWRPGRSGVVHCFSGTRQELEAYLALDLYIGITGIITIQARGAGLREMVREIPPQRMLIETDAPYLTPVPERNKHRRNEPAFVRSVLYRLANLLGHSPETMARQLWENTCRLFDWTPEAES